MPQAQNPNISRDRVKKNAIVVLDQQLRSLNASLAELENQIYTPHALQNLNQITAAIYTKTDADLDKFSLLRKIYAAQDDEDPFEGVDLDNAQVADSEGSQDDSFDLLSEEAPNSEEAPIEETPKVEPTVSTNTKTKTEVISESKSKNTTKKADPSEDNTAKLSELDARVKAFVEKHVAEFSKGSSFALYSKDFWRPFKDFSQEDLDKEIAAKGGALTKEILKVQSFLQDFTSLIKDIKKTLGKKASPAISNKISSILDNVSPYLETSKGLPNLDDESAKEFFEGRVPDILVDSLTSSYGVDFLMRMIHKDLGDNSFTSTGIKEAFAGVNPQTSGDTDSTQKNKPITNIGPIQTANEAIEKALSSKKSNAEKVHDLRSILTPVDLSGILSGHKEYEKIMDDLDTEKNPVPSVLKSIANRIKELLKKVSKTSNKAVKRIDPVDEDLAPIPTAGNTVEEKPKAPKGINIRKSNVSIPEVKTEEATKEKTPVVDTAGRVANTGSNTNSAEESTLEDEGFLADDSTSKPEDDFSEEIIHDVPSEPVSEDQSPSGETAPTAEAVQEENTGSEPEEQTSTSPLPEIEEDSEPPKQTEPTKVNESAVPSNEEMFKILSTDGVSVVKHVLAKYGSYYSLPEKGAPVLHNGEENVYVPVNIRNMTNPAKYNIMTKFVEVANELDLDPRLTQTFYTGKTILHSPWINLRKILTLLTSDEAALKDGKHTFLLDNNKFFLNRVPFLKGWVSEDLTIEDADNQAQLYALALTYKAVARPGQHIGRIMKDKSLVDGHFTKLFPSTIEGKAKREVIDLFIERALKEGIFEKQADGVYKKVGPELVNPNKPKQETPVEPSAETAPQDTAEIPTQVQDTAKPLVNPNKPRVSAPEPVQETTNENQPAPDDEEDTPVGSTESAPPSAEQSRPLVNPNAPRKLEITPSVPVDPEEVKETPPANQTPTTTNSLQQLLTPVKQAPNSNPLNVNPMLVQLSKELKQTNAKHKNVSGDVYKLRESLRDAYARLGLLVKQDVIPSETAQAYLQNLKQLDDKIIKIQRNTAMGMTSVHNAVIPKQLKSILASIRKYAMDYLSYNHRDSLISYSDVEEEGDGSIAMTTYLPIHGLRSSSGRTYPKMFIVVTFIQNLTATSMAGAYTVYLGMNRLAKHSLKDDRQIQMKNFTTLTTANIASNLNRLFQVNKILNARDTLQIFTDVRSKGNLIPKLLSLSDSDNGAHPAIQAVTSEGNSLQVHLDPAIDNEATVQSYVKKLTNNFAVHLGKDFSINVTYLPYDRRVINTAEDIYTSPEVSEPKKMSNAKRFTIEIQLVPKSDKAHVTADDFEFLKHAKGLSEESIARITQVVNHQFTR